MTVLLCIGDAIQKSESTEELQSVNLEPTRIGFKKGLAVENINHQERQGPSKNAGEKTQHSSSVKIGFIL